MNNAGEGSAHLKGSKFFSKKFSPKCISEALQPGSARPHSRKITSDSHASWFLHFPQLLAQALDLGMTSLNRWNWLDNVESAW